MCIVITEGRNGDGGGVVVKMCRGAVRHMILMKEDSREIREEKNDTKKFPIPCIFIANKMSSCFVKC